MPVIDNMKFVEFGKYCESCKYWTTRDKMHFNPNIGEYNGEEWTGKYVPEEYYPCYLCLLEAVREGTEVPMYWEAK